MASVCRSSSSDLDPSTPMPFTWHKRVVITASAVSNWLPLLKLVVWHRKEQSIIGRLDLNQLLSRIYSYPTYATGRRHTEYYPWSTVFRFPRAAHPNFSDETIRSFFPSKGTDQTQLSSFYTKHTIEIRHCNVQENHFRNRQHLKTFRSQLYSTFKHHLFYGDMNILHSHPVRGRVNDVMAIIRSGFFGSGNATAHRNLTDIWLYCTLNDPSRSCLLQTFMLRWIQRSDNILSINFQPDPFKQTQLTSFVEILIQPCVPVWTIAVVSIDISQVDSHVGNGLPTWVFLMLGVSTILHSLSLMARR